MQNGDDEEFKDRKLHEAIASELGLKLHALYTIPSVAAVLGVDETTVRRNKKRIGYVSYGPRGVRFFGFQIVDYIVKGISGA